MKPRRAAPILTTLAAALTAAVITAPAGHANPGPPEATSSSTTDFTTESLLQPQQPDASDETRTPVAQDRLRTVYLTNTKSRKDRSEAIIDTSKVAKQWFADQGLDLRWKANDVTIVRDTALAKAIVTYNSDNAVSTLLTDAGVINANEIPIVYVERPNQRIGSCGWAEQGDTFSAILPVGACGIYPTTNQQWPHGGSYLLAHEIGHTLGADHISKPRAALLYQGSKDRAWNKLRIAAPNKQVMKQSPVVKNA